MTKPNFSTLPSNATQEIEVLKKRLAANTQGYTTLAICATPSVSNKLMCEPNTGNGELHLDVTDDHKEFYLNWSHGGYLNPTEAVKNCPQVRQLMQLAESAELVVDEDEEGIKVKDQDFWLKSLLKSGFSFYNPEALPEVEEYEPENFDTDNDRDLSLKHLAATPIDLLDSETNTVVKSSLTAVEGKRVVEGETYIYKFACIPDGSIPRLTNSDKPAFVWGNKKEVQVINREWKEIEKLLSPSVSR